jgi:hypothetical protein
LLSCDKFDTMSHQQEDTIMSYESQEESMIGCLLDYYFIALEQDRDYARATKFKNDLNIAGYSLTKKDEYKHLCDMLANAKENGDTVGEAFFHGVLKEHHNVKW